MPVNGKSFHTLIQDLGFQYCPGFPETTPMPEQRISEGMVPHILPILVSKYHFRFGSM